MWANEPCTNILKQLPSAGRDVQKTKATTGLLHVHVWGLLPYWQWENSGLVVAILWGSLFLRNLGLTFSGTCPTLLILDVHGSISYRTLVSTDILSLLPLLPPAGHVWKLPIYFQLPFPFCFVWLLVVWYGLASLFFNSALTLFWITGRFQHAILNIGFILMGAIISDSNLEWVFLFSVFVELFLFSFVFLLLLFVFVLSSVFNQNYSS